MITIGIDGNEANVEKKVGIGEFAYQLIFEFSKLSLRNKNLKFVVYLKNKPLPDMPSQTASWKYKIIGPKPLWTQIGLPLRLLIEREKPNVFFTPTHYAPRFSFIPQIISIMDLSYIFFPETFKKRDLAQLKNWTNYSVKRSKRIFTISKSSKNDILKEYKIDDSRVKVIYPGIKQDVLDVNLFSMDKLSDKYNINSDFVLFVGTLQPRKNIVRLIQAFKKLNKPSLKLVIVGKKGWLYDDILNAPLDLGIEDKVIFLDYVKDRDLPALYKNAKCFVLPSLYEGFGLPVLEAMKHGCPVVVSDISSLPEAGGDAALYFDPKDISDIAQKIDKVLTDKEKRSDMIKKGYAQVKKFSWEKTAREALKYIEEEAE